MGSEHPNEPQILNVAVDLALADTVRAGYEVFARRARTAIAVYCTLVLVAAVFLAVATVNESTHPRGLGLVVAGIAAAFLLPAAAVGMIYWSAKSAFERSGSGSHQMRFRFCPDGVGIWGKFTPGWVAWDSFDGALETSSSFLLFESAQDYFLIPKRCLGGAEQVSLLRDMLGRHLVRNDRRGRAIVPPSGAKL